MLHAPHGTAYAGSSSSSSSKVNAVYEAGQVSLERVAKHALLISLVCYYRFYMQEEITFNQISHHERYFAFF
jgi:hypothetical protein